MEVDPSKFKGIDNATDEAFQRDVDEDTTSLSSHEKSDDQENASKHDKAWYQVTRWKRLQKHYSDQYVDFFDDSCEHDTDRNASWDLPPSQIGATKWSSDEKDALFTAVAKYGRHDMERISKAVTTKSPIEVNAYMKTVLQAYIDRQLFMANAKNASSAQFPAAIEIGPDCETALDVAADAFNAYQEQFDVTAGQNENGRLWLIDRETATGLDTEFEQNESSSDAGSMTDGDDGLDHWQAKENDRPRGLELFRLSTMLDLSEEFFMNSIAFDLESHWTNIAELGQRPALLQDCVQTLFDLVVDYLRQIIGLALHAANARLASTRSTGYSPSESLGSRDIFAALDILKLPYDSWDFWTKLARRNKFRVITGSHSKGESRAKLISYDKAEAVLGQRRGRGPRRSMSIGSEASSTASQNAALAEASSGLDSDWLQTSDINSDEREDVNSNGNELDYEATRSDSFQDSQGSSDSETDEDVKHGVRSDRGGEAVSLEDATESYAETLDQIARANEERQIWQILGKRSRIEVKEENGRAQGPRPKTMRKTPNELKGWSCQYLTEWEHHRRSHLPTMQRVEDSHHHLSS